jgi:hypothetical protein
VRLVHNLFVGALVLLTALAFTATAVAGWTHQTALVSDRFVAVVNGVVTDPQVADSMGQRVADQVVERLGLQQRVTDLLPPRLAGLAVPVTQAVHDAIDKAVDNLLSNPQFQTLLTAALERLHTGLLNVVNGNSDYFTTTNGKLTLDLLAVIDTVVAQLQTDGVLPTQADFPKFSQIADRTDFLNKLSSYLQTQLPPDFGQIPIADESSVQAVANALHAFDVAIYALAILTVVLGLAALLFAHRRWNAVAWLGITILVLFGLGIAALLAVSSKSASVVANPDNPVLAGALVGALADSLTQWMAVLGVAVLIVTIPVVFMARRSKKAKEAAATVAPA